MSPIINGPPDTCIKRKTFGKAPIIYNICGAWLVFPIHVYYYSSCYVDNVKFVVPVPTNASNGSEEPYVSGFNNIQIDDIVLVEFFQIHHN